MNEASTTEEWFSRGRSWEQEHQPYVEAWLEQQTERDPAGAGCDVWEFAAHSLLRIPEARGEGRAPGDPDREAYVWDEIDAYEILFCHTVHGGCPVFEPEEYLRLMGSFARFLGEAGVIGAQEHAVLQAEWDLWSARLLEVWERGGWYFPDGTHRSPQGIARHNGELAYEEPRPKTRPSKSKARPKKTRKRRRSAGRRR